LTKGEPERCTASGRAARHDAQAENQPGQGCKPIIQYGKFGGATLQESRQISPPPFSSAMVIDAWAKKTTGPQ